MQTSTDRKPVYVKYGEATFAMNGKSFTLNLYRSIELSKQEKYKDDLFLPFSDLTSGNETYIGGRYIDLKIPQGKYDCQLILIPLTIRIALTIINIHVLRFLWKTT